MESFWQLGDQLRGHTKDSEEQKWVVEATKLAEQTRSKANRVNNLYFSRAAAEMMPARTMDYFPEEKKFDHLNISMLNLDSKLAELNRKSSIRENIYNPNELYLGSSGGYLGNAGLRVGRPKFSIDNQNNREINDSSKIKTSNNNSNKNDDNNNALDKRFKTLPAAETLPRNEVLGGYIFVCNNDTMQEDLKRNLFGLPPRYRDSVRAITPGLPLFLYNYTTHQLHGIFEATSFGGSNIDPTAWEDKKCKGESRFPAQVRTRVRNVCEALEEDSFRPVLHHYDGPKFRLELSVPETLALLDLFEGENK